MSSPVECKISDRLKIDTGDGATAEVSVSDVIEAIKRPTPKAMELASLVAEMRHAQTNYFRTRSVSALEDSRRKESKVDKACQAILDGQRTMFE